MRRILGVLAAVVLVGSFGGCCHNTCCYDPVPAGPGIYNGTYGYRTDWNAHHGRRSDCFSRLFSRHRRHRCGGPCQTGCPYDAYGAGAWGDPCCPSHYGTGVYGTGDWTGGASGHCAHCAPGTPAGPMPYAPSPAPYSPPPSPEPEPAPPSEAKPLAAPNFVPPAAFYDPNPLQSWNTQPQPRRTAQRW